MPCVTRTTPAIIKNINAKIIISIIIDLCPATSNSYSCKIEIGNLAMIPINIISEIPLPSPLSVICSPIHIINIVPDVRIMIVETIQPKPWTASGTIGIFWYWVFNNLTVTPQACIAEIKTVPYLVNWVIFFLPSSPSCCNFWK